MGHKSFEQLARTAFEAHTKEMERQGAFTPPYRKPAWEELQPEFSRVGLPQQNRSWPRWPPCTERVSSLIELSQLDGLSIFSPGASQGVFSKGLQRPFEKAESWMCA